MIKIIRKAKMKKYFLLLFLFISYNICCIAQEGNIITPTKSLPDSLVFGKSGFLDIDYLITRDGDIGKYHIALIRLFENNKDKVVFNKRFPEDNKKIGLILVKRLQKWVDDFVKKSRFEKLPNFHSEIKKVKDKYLLYGVHIEFRHRCIKRKMNGVK